MQPTRLLRILLILFAGLYPLTSSSQLLDEKTASAKLDKAFGGFGDTDDYAIWFEGITFGVDDPKSIFNLPVYKLYRGGFMFMKGEKFEIQLGAFKALGDGKLNVIVDELSQTMIVDSLRKNMPAEFGEAPDLNAMLTEMFGEGVLLHEADEYLNGQNCHRMRITTAGEHPSHTIYWINIATGKLILMAEWQGTGYDAYWISSVGKTPAGHDFSVNLPKEEMEEFYGYQVIDLRYSLNDMYKQRN